jgi:hypothetical protein
VSSFNTERQQLATLVSAVQVGGQAAFNQVYQYEEPNYWTTLPCATVMPAPDGSVETLYGNVNSEMRHVWHVSIYYPFEATAACEASFQQLVDATLTALRASNSVSLGGNVQYAVIGSQTFGYLSSKNDSPDIRRATISITARSLIQRTP